MGAAVHQLPPANPGAWLDVEPGAGRTAVRVGARPMRKTVYTVAVNQYAPAVRALTLPLLESWCQKIGAELYVITERKFPDAPPAYEKLQVFELAQRHGNDWSFCVDSDALIHPDFYDPTLLVPKDTVFHNGSDPALLRCMFDHYFLRDGRNIGSCNWFAAASDWCLDLWHPLDDLSIEEAIARIRPTTHEQNSGVDAAHLLDDYVLARNIARYGLKFTTVAALNKQINVEPGFLWHVYGVPEAKKIEMMKETLTRWEINSAEGIV